MRDLVLAVLGGLVLWAGLTCAMHKGGRGPEVEVHVDNRGHSTVNLIVFDRRTGSVLERLHNLSMGHAERSVDFHAVEHRQIGVAVDVHGGPPIPIGGNQPQTIVVREPSDVICVTVAPVQTQHMLYMHACVG